jgi:hypothetical protein
MKPIPKLRGIRVDPIWANSTYHFWFPILIRVHTAFQQYGVIIDCGISGVRSTLVAILILVSLRLVLGRLGLVALLGNDVFNKTRERLKGWIIGTKIYNSRPFNTL